MPDSQKGAIMELLMYTSILRNIPYKNSNDW